MTKTTQKTNDLINASDDEAAAAAMIAPVVLHFSEKRMIQKIQPVMIRQVIQTNWKRTMISYPRTETSKRTRRV
jgi:hypothetical protein